MANSDPCASVPHCDQAVRTDGTEGMTIFLGRVCADTSQCDKMRRMKKNQKDGHAVVVAVPILLPISSPEEM